jgi:hypothetical protein
LDKIRSLHNIGSVFRTSDAFRIECIYLCGITAIPPHPEMHNGCGEGGDRCGGDFYQCKADCGKLPQR